MLVVVSHDQHFMNDVCTDIINCRDQQLIYYPNCTWDEYKRKFRTSVQLERAAYEKARRAKKTGLQRPPKDYEVSFEFSTPSKISGGNLIEVHNASFWYNRERALFRDLEFGIDLKSRIALVGPNGAGKTTLLNLLKGQLEPKTGTVTLNRKLIIGEFTQHFIERLDGNETPIEHLQKVISSEELTEKYLWKRLAAMGLTQKTPTQPIRTLSGGQKSRLTFTELSLRCPHILVLDEPTNHLDVESIEALADALRQYKGAILLVSHDVRLISDICNELWVINGDGSVEIHEESFQEYKDKLVEECRHELELEKKRITEIQAKKSAEAAERNARNAIKVKN